MHPTLGRYVPRPHTTGTSRRDLTIHFTRAAALLGAVGASCFFVSSLVAQAMDGDNRMSSDFVSELALGRAGLLMTTSFWLHGATIVILSMGLTRGVRPSVSHLASNVLVGAGGVGILMLGFFRMDAPDADPTFSGVMHVVLAGVAFAALAAAFLLFAHAISHDRHWDGFRPYAYGMGGLAFLALVLFAGALGLDFLDVVEADAYLGALERVLSGVNLAWILVTTVKLRAVACAEDHFVEEEGVLFVQ